jgi:16S rRNA processing protein RimM
MDRSRWVPVAEVSRAHGLRGELRVRLFNKESSLLRSGMRVWLETRGAAPREVELEAVRGATAGIKLVKVRGIDDPDRAAELRGAVVCAKREAFPDLDQDEFYVCDVIGAKLVGPGGELGTVQDVVTYPGAEALVVRPTAAGSDTVEVPLVDAFIERVDTENATVVAKERILELFR